jgi:DNA-binding response OmpR family regulator
MNANLNLPKQSLPPAFHQARRLTKRILLADDDPGVRETLGRVLESERYAVTFAKTGHEAAAKFVSDPPDLVLLDLNMPGKDGWAAFRLMNAAHPLLPVIVITARPHQYQQAVDLGVDAFMEKPLNLPVLLDAIRDLLTESEAERTRRLTNPGFETAFLNHTDQASGNGDRS